MEKLIGRYGVFLDESLGNMFGMHCTKEGTIVKFTHLPDWLDSVEIELAKENDMIGFTRKNQNDFVFIGFIYDFKILTDLSKEDVV